MADEYLTETVELEPLLPRYVEYPAGGFEVVRFEESPTWPDEEPDMSELGYVGLSDGHIFGVCAAVAFVLVTLIWLFGVT